ncbi:MAG: preprotein translocase subunit SecG [Clostridia bacterium]|nr:preprotein translocase subunit SecG [Clostridia bacterium]
MLKILTNVLHIIVCLVIIAMVLLQSGKQAGLSGSIAGGAETFFGKNKGRTIDAILSKLTTAAAIIFLVTSIILQIFVVKK